MPRVEIMDPFGTVYRCDTTQLEAVLRPWFADILPIVNIKGLKGPSGETIWPRIRVYPFAFKPGETPDWLCDSRVISELYEFRATDGETGILALSSLRRQLERTVMALDHERKRRSWA